MKEDRIREGRGVLGEIRKRSEREKKRRRNKFLILHILIVPVLEYNSN